MKYVLTIWSQQIPLLRQEAKRQWWSPNRCFDWVLSYQLQHEAGILQGRPESVSDNTNRAAFSGQRTFPWACSKPLVHLASDNSILGGHWQLVFTQLNKSLSGQTQQGSPIFSFQAIFLWVWCTPVCQYDPYHTLWSRWLTRTSHATFSSGLKSNRSCAGRCWMAWMLW